MPDISMCSGNLTIIETKEKVLCPSRFNCYRFTAIPNPYWQSYMMMQVDTQETFDKDKRCDYFTFD